MSRGQAHHVILLAVRAADIVAEDVQKEPDELRPHGDGPSGVPALAEVEEYFDHGVVEDAKLIEMAGGFLVLMVGLLWYGWGFVEIGALFFWIGIVVPVAGGLPVTEMIDKNIEGMRSVMIAVIMMSAAQVVYFILHDALILDTILNYFAGYLVRVPEFVVAYVMFGTSAIMAALLGSANLSSRRWVTDQYDSCVQVNTVTWPGHGAAVIRVKGTRRALVATTDAKTSASGVLAPALSFTEDCDRPPATG